MPVVSRLRAFARNVFQRSSVDRDLRLELGGYLESLTAEHMRRGLSRADAERAARLELGSVDHVTENVRDVRTGALLDVVLRDVRFAVRSLRKTPAFTAAAVAALALGIGANTAILSVVNAVLLRPLAYADADRLVVLLHRGYNPVAPANFVDWRRQTMSFTDMAAAEFWSPHLTGVTEPESIQGLHMSAGMFPMLGVRPLLGRVFDAREDQPGDDRVAVISYGLWQRRFAGDRNVIGTRVQLDGQPFTIIGVMPSEFQFAPFWATHAEIWAPIALGPRAASRGGNSLRVFARLRPGVTIDQARADVAAVTARLEQQYPGSNRDVVVTPLKEKVVGNIRTPLVVLLVAVAFVLLIACSNVAHMLLARATARKRELAVRVALGASRTRIVAQLLAESGMLALLGGLFGLAIAFVGVRLLVAAAPTAIPRVATVSIDARVLAMTIAITALTAVVFGLAPAARSARVDLAEAFKDGGRASSDGRSRRRLRDLLVMSEFALALVLLVGAGLMIRSFVALRRIDPGFDPRNVVAMLVSTTGTAEADSSVRLGFFREVLARTAALPGVESASFINHLPIAGDQWGMPFAVEGRAKPKAGDEPSATYRVVFPGYFRTMRIPLLHGRDVTETDRLDAPHVVVINDFMARKYWPGEDAIGKRIRIGSDSSWMTVVGVAKNDVRSDWSAPPEDEVFVPFLQEAAYLKAPEAHHASMTLVVRTRCMSGDACDPSAIAAPLVTAIRSIDRNVPISQVQTMMSVVQRATAESQFYLVLLAAFAAIAVTLAAVGIYGVMSYGVSRRTNEIGIRIALGATPGAVLGSIVRQGLSLALAGAMVGLVAALALTRLMGQLLYGVSPTDPLTFAAVVALLCGVAVMATLAPARRATHIDPLAALRAD